MSDTDTTSALRRAISLSPERRVQATIGALWTAGVALVSCAVICTVYIVRLDEKVERTQDGVQEIQEQLKPVVPQHTILWEAYTRSAARARTP